MEVKKSVMDSCKPVLAGARLPESPQEPMEFLSRSWSLSALEVSKALAPPPPVFTKSKAPSTTTISEDISGESEDPSTVLTGDPFSFSSSTTSQLVLERIMSQSEISPLTSGRPSLSSEPLNGGQSCGSLTETDSPPNDISPSQDFDDVVKFFRSRNNALQPQLAGGRSTSGSTTPGGGARTVGRWLKDRKEKKKEETRAHNAQLHAAVSVAGVAAAVAAIAAATTSSSAPRKDEQIAKTDTALASAATLVAAQCVEAAEALGAERDHLASVVGSAVNVRSYDDIMTLTAAAATALRGAATLKARALKEVWSTAAVLPVEKGIGTFVGTIDNFTHPDAKSNGEIAPREYFPGVCSQKFLARGCELLKRTRKGDLHWKIVSIYINQAGQVSLKMKSKHVARTITKKKKNVVLEVFKDLPAWPGRHLLEEGEQRRYFGLKTEMRGIVEFECKNQREHDMWTEGVLRLLSIVANIISEVKCKIPRSSLSLRLQAIATIILLGCFTPKFKNQILKYKIPRNYSSL